MIFQKKYQRGMELLRKKNGSDPDQSDAENREIKRRAAADEKVELEKHDTLAMLLSALMTFLPVALIVLLLLCLPILLVALLH